MTKEKTVLDLTYDEGIYMLVSNKLDDMTEGEMREMLYEKLTNEAHGFYSAQEVSEYLETPSTQYNVIEYSDD